jgi:ABC-type transporter Mla maintaining outer membrane lipid asymmetry ATPase subunit MlaF
LRIERLSVFYGDVEVLSKIDLGAKRGEVVVIFGESGCGKSVLFRTLTGLEPPDQGRVTILGEDLYRVGDRQRTRLLRHLGVAHQAGALLKSLSVFDNVLLPLKEVASLSYAKAGERVEELLEHLQLGAVAKLLPARLSRGEVKRTALARAMALKPEILICDDIFSGLDWGTQLYIFELFEKLAKTFGKTVIVFTPAPEVALKVAHRLLILDQGRLIAQGTPAEILEITDPTVDRVFHSHLRAFQGRANLLVSNGGTTAPTGEAQP